ncbi:hypothetical protein [Yokenella regensburgei]|uniref:hypothetical protein n=1 Tax=Yokenella regensburgei TaxID=158877 RepID=UPI0031E496B5
MQKVITFSYLIKLFILPAIILTTGCDEKKDTWTPNEFHLTSVEQGRHLYLDRRMGLITHRAIFDHASDCDLVHNHIQQQQPTVLWFCAGKVKD